MEKLIVFKSRMSLNIAILFTILSLTVSCTKSSMDRMTGTGTGSGTGGSKGPGTNEVWIQNMAFNPASITVTAGTTIVWTNKDAVTHDVTSDKGSFSSGPLGTGATYSKTFTAVGTYSYICSIHPSMTGTVVVQ